MIGLVSESLRNLLEAQMDSAAKVTLLSPAETSAHQTRVNLFCYRVATDPFLANQDFAPKPDDPDVLVAPPLALSLFYLLTPYATLDAETGLADAQTVMAEAMRVLHEHTVVPQSALEGDLIEGDVRVTLHAADIEELSKLWTSLNEELRLSAVYEVSYVPVPARAERAAAPPVERAEVAVELTP